MVKPLKGRTMTLSELQLATVDLCRKVRFQLNRQAHDEGMNDFEFVEQILEPLETRIYQDRQVIKTAKAEKKRSLDHGNTDH